MFFSVMLSHTRAWGKSKEVRSYIHVLYVLVLLVLLTKSFDAPFILYLKSVPHLFLSNHTQSLKDLRFKLFPLSTLYLDNSICRPLYPYILWWLKILHLLSWIVLLSYHKGYYKKQKITNWTRDFCLNLSYKQLNAHIK